MRSFTVVRHALLCCTFALLLFATLSNTLSTDSTNDSCESVLSVLDNAFYMYVGQLQRGAPHPFMLQSFSTAIQVLLQNVIAWYPTATCFASVCLDSTQLDDIRLATRTSTGFKSSFLHTTAAQVEPGIADESLDYFGETSVFHYTLPDGLIEDINDSSPFRDNVFQAMGIESAIGDLQTFHGTIGAGAVFYLPRTSLPDHDLPTLHANSRAHVMEVWSRIVQRLYQPPNSVTVSEVAQLPETVKVFYDPNEHAVQGNFTRQLIAKHKASGVDLLYTVAAMVLQLKLAGVDDSKSLQLLAHTAGFLFNGMRSHRVERENIIASTIFLAFYDQAFRNWTSNTDMEKVPNVDPEVVESLYGAILEPLLWFCTGGKLKYSSLYVNGTVTYTDIGIQLLDNVRIETLQLAMLVREAELSWEKRTSWDRSMATLVRTEGTCVSGYVYFELGTDPDENCCAAVCENLELISTVGVMSMLECCTQCNWLSCGVFNNEPLSGILTIMVHEYGWQDPTAVSVTV